MAKNFQRHARGGRFDKQDFGDLGLRAFKNQQDQIIESLKLQQARTNEYSKEYASGIAGVGVSEEKNRNILNSLENQVFENRRQNVQKRGKREIENIESKAKEFGRAAEFWKDFSTTYSKNFGIAAQGLADLQQSMSADAQMQEWLENGKFDQLAEFGDEAQSLTEKKLHAKIAKSWKDGNVEEVELGHTIFKTGNRFLTQKVLAKLKEDHEGHWGAFKDFVNNNESLEWNETTIPQLAQFRARQLIQEFGLENSKAGRELYDFWTSKGEAEARKIRTLKSAQKGDGEQLDSIEWAGSQKTALSRQQALYVIDRTRRTDDKGEAVAAFNNGHQSLIHMAERLAPSYPLTAETFIDDMMDTPFMGGVLGRDGKWTEGTFNTRYKGAKNTELRKQLQEIWIDMKKKDLKKSQDLLIANGVVEYTKLEQNLIDPGTEDNPNPDFIDLTTEDGWIKATKLLSKFKPYSELTDAGSNPYRRLTGAMGLKPGTVDLQSVDYLIGKADAVGDEDEFARLWPLLSKEQRERHAPKYERLNILRNGGGTFKDVEKQAKDLVAEASGLQTIDAKTHPTGVKIAKVLEQSFRHEFNKLDVTKYEGKPSWETQMVQDAWALATKDFHNETGLYKPQTPDKGEPGGTGKKVYIFAQTKIEPENSLNSKQIVDSLSDGVNIFDNKLPSLLISKRETGYLAHNIQSDKTVNIPEGLFLYAKLTNRPVTEVTNQWLEQNDYSQRLNPNQHDYAMLKAENLLININNLKPWNGIAVTEYGSVIRENPEFKMNLMTPEVRKRYLEMRGILQ